jgi:hypothetical protein
MPPWSEFPYNLQKYIDRLVDRCYDVTVKMILAGCRNGVNRADVQEEEAMFQNDWMLQRLAQERRNDLMQQLAHARLIGGTKSIGREPGHTWYHALDWIGGQLIRQGERLQTRHALYHAQSLTHITRG